MTPNDMLATLRGYGIRCDIVNTGGGCGAIALDTPRGEILVTPNEGPWGTPAADDMDVETIVWRVALHDGDGMWVDSELVRDGDATVTDDRVPHAVELLARFADWSHRGIINAGTV